MKKGLISYELDDEEKDFNMALDALMNNDFTTISAVDGVYPTTNENLDSLFKCLNFSGKRLMTVGSSGDQVIYGIASGASSITLIDANPMSLPHTELKLAAIKNLTYEEFIDYFNANNIFNAKYYARVSHDLSEQSREFWDSILLNTSGQEASGLQSRFSQGAVYASFFRCAVGLYNSPEIFNKAKQNLDKCDIEFVLSYFGGFYDKIKDKEPYDIMLLSNVYDYVVPEKFFNGLVNLSECLTEDGLMQVYYDFDKGLYKGYRFNRELAKFMGNKELKADNSRNKSILGSSYKTRGVTCVELDYPIDLGDRVVYAGPSAMILDKAFFASKRPDKNKSSFEELKRYIANSLSNNQNKEM